MEHDDSKTGGARRMWEKGVSSYVDSGLIGAEDSSHRLADEGDLFEDAGLADQNVERGLANTDVLRLVRTKLIDCESIRGHTSRKASNTRSASGSCRSTGPTPSS